MGRSRKKKRNAKPRDRRSADGPAHAANADRRRIVIRFVAWLAGLTIVFNALFILYFSNLSTFESYLQLNANISASILRVLGEDATSESASVITPRFSLEIRKGCDAIQASAFFVFIVLTSPLAVSRLKRVPIIAAGVALLLVVNLVRVITLYYTGVHFSREFFEVMHKDVWQALFIFMPLFFWFVWVRGTRHSVEITNETRQ